MYFRLGQRGNSRSIFARGCCDDLTRRLPPKKALNDSENRKIRLRQRCIRYLDSPRRALGSTPRDFVKGQSRFSKNASNALGRQGPLRCHRIDDRLSYEIHSAQSKPQQQYRGKANKPGIAKIIGCPRFPRNKGALQALAHTGGCPALHYPAHHRQPGTRWQDRRFADVYPHLLGRHPRHRRRFGNPHRPVDHGGTVFGPPYPVRDQRQRPAPSLPPLATRA